MKKKAMMSDALSVVLGTFFTELAVAAALTVPLSQHWVELTIRILSCILFLDLAVGIRYYGHHNNKRIHK